MSPARWLLFVICLVVVWLMFRLRPVAPEKTKTIHAAAPSVVTGASLGWEKERHDLDETLLSFAPEGEKPLPFKTKTRVHLRPGESAVIGFWQVSKDSNGLAVVTPETLPDGTMKLAAKLLQVSDAVASDKAVRDLFPAPFDLQQSGAMKQEAVKAALDHLQDIQGADMLSMPSILTLPGRKATLQVGQLEPGSTDPFGGMQHGIELQLSPDIPSADGSFDLDLSLNLK